MLKNSNEKFNSTERVKSYFKDKKNQDDTNFYAIFTKLVNQAASTPKFYVTVYMPSE